MKTVGVVSSRFVVFSLKALDAVTLVADIQQRELKILLFSKYLFLTGSFTSSHCRTCRSIMLDLL